jgi:hypothetical protein
VQLCGTISKIRLREVRSCLSGPLYKGTFQANAPSLDTFIGDCILKGNSIFFKRDKPLTVPPHRRLLLGKKGARGRLPAQWKGIL